MQRIKRRLAVGAAGVAVLGAGGAAYAATHSSNPRRDAFLNDLAGRLHVSRSQLDQALSAATADQLDAAVKAGRMTRARADAILNRQRQTGAVPFLGGHRPGFAHGPFRAGLRAAATYLGLTPAELRGQLAAGKSLADVAKARGKSVSGLKAALRDAARMRLDAAVKKGWITQAQEDQILADIDSRLDALVNRAGLAPRWRPGHPWGGGPPGGGPGVPPWGGP